MKFDLLIKNGTVIDSALGMHSRADVAIARGHVAAIDTSIPAGAAVETHDATGSYVTPGLIDMHTFITGFQMRTAAKFASKGMGAEGDPRLEKIN